MKDICIVYSTNDEFSPYCSISIQSLINNSNNNYKYNIYIFYIKLSNNNINILKKMSKENIIIKCINLSNIFNKDKYYEINNYTYEIYLRLYAPLLLKYSKILYLDSDTIINGDITPLFKTNMKNEYIGLVKDYNNYLKNGDNKYNSGIILFNSKQFELNKIREKCIDYFIKHDSLLPDQDALNDICKDHIIELHPKYNYQLHASQYNKFKNNTLSKYKKLFDFNPIIIHYTYITKPNKIICSKYDNLFWKYAESTHYYNKLYKNFTSNIYDIVYNSPIEEIYLEKVNNGEHGLKNIFYVFFNSINNWFKYKMKGNKDEN